MGSQALVLEERWLGEASVAGRENRMEVSFCCYYYYYLLSSIFLPIREFYVTHLYLCSTCI